MPESSSPAVEPTTPTRAMTPQEAARLAFQREHWADNPDLLAEIEKDMLRQLSRPAPPPCPSWCTETMHDGFDDLNDDEGRQLRSHEVAVSPNVVVVVEEIRDADDTITMSEPFILADVPNKGELTGPQARELSAGLLQAADRLVELTKGAKAA